MDGCSELIRKDGIQLEGCTTQRITDKKFCLEEMGTVHIFLFLIDFMRFFFKLDGKGTVKKKGISQLDELQFRNLMKGPNYEK
jgi:hypothetical protein